MAESKTSNPALTPAAAASASVSSPATGILDSLIKKLQDSIEHIKPTAENLTLVAMRAMMLVEAVGSLTGPEKKDLVLRMVLGVIEKGLDPSDADELMMFAKLMLPQLIDSAIGLANGSIRIAKEVIADNCGSCCTT